MGKLLVVGALALLLGVFVGGLGPRAELRRTRAEVAELKAAAARGGATAALPLALGVGSLMAAQQRARGRAPGPPRFVPADPRGGPSAPDPDPRPAHAERGDAGAGRRFDGKALAAAQAAADVRAAQYRAAFVQEAGLPPAGQAAMDQAIAQDERGAGQDGRPGGGAARVEEQAHAPGHGRSGRPGAGHLPEGRRRLQGGAGRIAGGRRWTGPTSTCSPRWTWARSSGWPIACRPWSCPAARCARERRRAAAAADPRSPRGGSCATWGWWPGSSWANRCAAGCCW